MKKILGITIVSLILFLNQTNKSFALEYGYGELKLTDHVVEAFIKYLKGKSKDTPYMFSVAIDGREYNYWVCPYGPGQCRDGNHN